MNCKACASLGTLSPLVATPSGVWCEACLKAIKRHGWGYPPMADGAWHAVDVWNGGYPERLRVSLRDLRELQREMPPRDVAVAYIRQRAVGR